MLNQFNIDAPRLHIEINGYSLQNRCADYIKKCIERWCLVTTNISTKKAMYWCTQTAYADIYETKQKSLPKQHILVDDGIQTVQFNNHIHIEKPFRVTKETQNGELDDVDFVTMVVDVYPSRDNIQWQHTKHKKTYSWPDDNILTIGVLCMLSFTLYFIH